MECRGFLLMLANFVAMILALVLLAMGVRTQLHALTGLACVILLVSLAGYLGSCCNSSCLLIMYSICMMALMGASVMYVMDPSKVKPLVAEPLEEYILASYMDKQGQPPCCPTLPLDKPRDLESWLATKLVSYTNKMVCAGSTLVGLPSCSLVVDIYLDTYGKRLATGTGVVALIAFAMSVAQVLHNNRK